MYAADLNSQLLRVLERPDLRIVGERLSVGFDPGLAVPFRTGRSSAVVLGPLCLGAERVCAFHVRHALELSLLLARGTPPALAGLGAARTASLFWQLDGDAEPDGGSTAAGWIAAMAADTPPAADHLATLWGELRALQEPGPGMDADPAGALARLAACWRQVGPTETLMATGGDQRLAINPATGLNHYGCSHRPRPWAVTFASSTASSLSERGFGGAEAARQDLVAAALAGQGEEAAADWARAVRNGIAAHFGLDDTAGVVLAASGTDCELVALAAAQVAGPVSSILTAPDETGSGVPLAAAGRHFASDTSQSQQVSKGSPIAGFDPATRVLELAVRCPDGTPREAAEIDAQCARMVAAERAAGRHVLLHLLDLSKTGLLAPSLDFLATQMRDDPQAVDVAVDACQARLDRGRVRDYLARGWMVLITGSKFFTGPPFCGAVLLPDTLMRRLRATGALPAGLAAYGSRTDWPEDLACADHLPAATNLGMVLRWQAALAEMRAIGAVPPAELHRRLGFFLSGVRDAIACRAELSLVDVPPPRRPAAGLREPAAPCWDELQTILSFLVLRRETAPEPEGGPVPLDLAEARCLYRWLNADVSRALPAGAGAEERRLARLLCHIGQPVPVAHPALGGRPAGALRISAGARLLSGEPSHEGLDVERRLAREIADARSVLDKIGLLLRHWPRLAALDPEPSYAPARNEASDAA